MTIAATSMRIELTGIGPNALNNDADRDDDVWMPNDPTITMPAAAITRPRAERGARSLPNTPPLSRPFPHDLCVTNDSVRRRLATCGVDFVWRDRRKAAGSLPQRNTVRKLAAGRLRSENSAPVYGFGQTRFTALNSRHALIAAMTTPTGIT